MSRGAKNGINEERDGGLAVCAGDADELETRWRDGGRNSPRRRPGRGARSLLSIGSRRRCAGASFGARVFTRDGYCSALDGVGDEAIAIGFRAMQCEK